MLAVSFGHKVERQLTWKWNVHIGRIFGNSFAESKGDFDILRYRAH